LLILNIAPWLRFAKQSLVSFADFHFAKIKFGDDAAGTGSGHQLLLPISAVVWWRAQGLRAYLPTAPDEIVGWPRQSYQMSVHEQNPHLTCK